MLGPNQHHNERCGKGLVEREECETDRRSGHLPPRSHRPSSHRTGCPDHVDAVRTLVFEALSSEQVTQQADLTGHLISHLSDNRRTGDTAHR